MGAPKGNKFALGNKGGKGPPPKYHSNYAKIAGLHQTHDVLSSICAGCALEQQIGCRCVRHGRSPVFARPVSVPVVPFLKPRGAPGLPPCKRHRRRPRMAGRWHAVPARVRAPHRGARLRFLRSISSCWSMGLSANCRCPPANAGVEG